MDENEPEISNPPRVVAIVRAMEDTAVWADVILWNNKSLEDYHQQIETKIVPYLRRENI